MAIAHSRSFASHGASCARCLAASLIFGGYVTACAVAPRVPQSPVEASTTYVNIGHTYQSTLKDLTWTHHELSAIARDGDAAGVNSGWEELTNLAVDCSDAQVRCITDDIYVFAVPRSELGLQPYVVRGVRFQVEKCFRGGSDHCSVALVSGTCDRLSELSENDEQHCIPSAYTSPSQQTKYAYVLYFVINENIGVTAFGIAPEPLAGDAERLAIVTQAVLTSGRGLLWRTP